MVTLEQLYRAIWQQDRPGYMKLVAEGARGAGVLLSRFQREDETQAEELLRMKATGSDGLCKRIAFR
jgi:hypothetical protein